MSTSDALSAVGVGARLGRLVALRIGEEELDGVGLAGRRLRPADRRVDVGSDAHGGEPTTRVRQPRTGARVRNSSLIAHGPRHRRPSRVVTPIDQPGAGTHDRVHRPTREIVHVARQSDAVLSASRWRRLLRRPHRWLIGGAALAAEPAQEANSQVTFSGGGLLGLACGSKPNAASVTVPAREHAAGRQPHRPQREAAARRRDPRRGGLRARPPTCCSTAVRSSWRSSPTACSADETVGAGRGAGRAAARGHRRRHPGQPGRSSRSATAAAATAGGADDPAAAAGDDQRAAAAGGDR